MSALALRAPQPAIKQELCVVTACHDLVCALPARFVERLLLPEEAELDERGRLRVGDSAYAPFNLGTLLGQAPLSQAWVLMRLTFRGQMLPLALSTGSCLVVEKLPPPTRLPAHLLTRRDGLIAGAFPAAAIKGRRLSSSLGIYLDPAHLLDSDELAAALRSVA